MLPKLAATPLLLATIVLCSPGVLSAQVPAVSDTSVDPRKFTPPMHNPGGFNGSRPKRSPSDLRRGPIVRTRASHRAGPIIDSTESIVLALTAGDSARGSNTKEIRYTLEGAETAVAVVAGHRATIVIASPGATTVTFYAVRTDGTQEAPQVLVLSPKRKSPSQ